MYALILAMRKEAEAIIAASVSLGAPTTHGEAIFEERDFEGKKFLLVLTGIGKVFASSGATALSLLYPNIEGVVNLGVSGSPLPKEIKILTPILATSFSQHDLDTTAIGDPIGYISELKTSVVEASPKIVDKLEKSLISLKLDYKKGRISSGDKFEGDPALRSRPNALFGSLASDMEAASLATIFKVYNIPFSSVRVISDGENPAHEYESNLAGASKLCQQIGFSFLSL